MSTSTTAATSAIETARLKLQGAGGYEMKANWFWIGKYLIVIVAALVLGAVLAGLEPFKSATIGTARIGAGSLVQFIAHAGALGMLWALGYRHSVQLRLNGGRGAALASTVLALVTLIVVASAYGVLLRFINPFLALDLKPFVDWTFIVGILSAAGWLLWVLFADSEAWMEAISNLNAGRTKPGAQIDDGARG
jgi:eukaryotic-like serine/threonine-protein kinase